MRRTSRGILAIDIALSLSHCIETRSTYALLLGRSNLQAAFIRQQVEELAKIAHHPAFLPTLVCSYHRTLLQKLSDSLNNDLFNVETDSGQTWTPIYNPRGFRRPGDCDDANITKRALGVIQLATAWEAYAKAVLCNIETIRDFMRYATSLVPEHRRSYVQLEDEIFHERLRFLEGKDKTVLWRFEYLKERAQAQQSAIYNYISLKNNETNSSLARDSRELAEASMRESYAMKSISVITMVFLPGTFVATLFATPAIAQAFPPQWAYWLVTIVLTLSVMGLWTGWYRWTTAQIAAATRARDMTRADVKNGRGTK
ncbi:hypothetical protein MMC10_010659 [Thelotrema lepadinum]|nr:hypothetical protein [Thelotrema lepadinum]